MKGFIGVTDNEWAEYIQSGSYEEVNFWSKKTKFKALDRGDLFFFLKKNNKTESGERKLIGYGEFKKFEALNFEDAWRKYGKGNGSVSEEKFKAKIIKMYGINNDCKIGCTILKKLVFFEKPLYLSNLNIEFKNSIVSGKTINEQEIRRILIASDNLVKIDFEEHENEDELIILPKEIEEGEIVNRYLQMKKRNGQARKLKLEDFKRKHEGKVYCEVCSEDEECVLDVHHDKTKVSDMEEGHVTRLEDLRIVCANCHRKIHYYNINVEELINQIN